MSEEKKKVAIVACTGMCKSLGTVTRQVAYKVVEELRPDKTVLICIPSLAANVGEYKKYLRDYPSIILDGCVERCAAKIVSKNSGSIKGRLFLPQLEKKYGLKPASRTEIGSEGEQLVTKIAEEVATMVDRLLQ
jgi:uncharacterized metal-binding protein